MADITERLRSSASGTIEWRVQDPETRAYCISFTEWNGGERSARQWLDEEIRAHPESIFAKHEVARVVALDHRDRLMLEAADEIDRLRARVAELEAARGEPVAYLHQVVCGDDEPDQALSFAPDNFPLSGVLGYRSLSHVPLYTAPLAPTVDVNAISDEALNAAWSYIIFNAENEQTEAVYDMRAALRAIFNKGE